MDIQVIRTEISNVFCDDAKDTVKVYKITFVHNGFQSFYEKEFTNGCDSFIKIDTLQSLKNFLKEMTSIKEEKEEIIAVFELENGELVCFSFTCDKSKALQEVEEITEQKVKRMDQVQTWQVPIYLEDMGIIKLNIK